MSAVGKME